MTSAAAAAARMVGGGALVDSRSSVGGKKKTQYEKPGSSEAKTANPSSIQLAMAQLRYALPLTVTFLPSTVDLNTQRGSIECCRQSPETKKSLDLGVCCGCTGRNLLSENLFA